MSKITTDVRKVNLTDIYNEARGCYNELWRQARVNGRDVKIYLHWTAGRYHQFWDSYEIQIDKDGSIYRYNGLDLDDIGDGTWLRNSGSISISLLCMFDGSTKSGGTNPPTEAQLESMVRVITVLCDALDLSIDKKRVLTHGEAADNEDGIHPHYDYGPKNTVERWDLEVLFNDESPKYNPWNEPTRGGSILRSRALWLRNHYGVGNTHIEVDKFAHYR